MEDEDVLVLVSGVLHSERVKRVIQIEIHLLGGLVRRKFDAHSALIQLPFSPNILTIALRHCYEDAVIENPISVVPIQSFPGFLLT